MCTWPALVAFDTYAPALPAAFGLARLTVFCFYEHNRHYWL